MSVNQKIMSEIAHKVADLMTKHGTDWVKPWQGQAGGFPVNVASGKQYRGINVFLLLSEGFSSQYWATFNQWKAAGAKIKKGSKATTIVLWKPLERQTENAEGETQTDRFWMLRTFKVFNADQVEGWEAPAQDVTATPVDANGFEHCPSIEEFFDEAGVQINHGGNSAFYAPSVDAVQMPRKEDFVGTDTSTAAEAYYSTLAHEVTHWTGHKSRLDRIKSTRFGDKDYAFEELVAEMGAVFLSVQFGISPAPRPDHAKYLNNWIAALKAEPKVIFSAASEAQKAVDFIAEAAEYDPAIAA